MTDAAHEPWRIRFFGSIEYSWLWCAQVISAFGDWVGLFAVTALAANISGEPAAATALVLTARVAPSLFLGPFMGVLVDRYDRKLLMRIADLSRAVVFIALPFVTTLWGLIVASLLLEIFTLMWSPAKEALVPSLVPRSRLTTANSLGVLAAYGTMPLAGVLQFVLKQANDRLAEVSWVGPLGFNRDIGETQSLAFYFNSLTFVATWFIVWRFIKVNGSPSHDRARPTPADDARSGGTDKGADADRPSGFRAMLAEIREGWSFIFSNPVVRAVNIGLAAGLLGGAMLVPLGPTFAKSVIGDVNAFSLYITALGLGVAIGVAALTAVQQKIPKERVFIGALFFAGVSLLVGVSMSTFWLSAVGVFGLGLGAGAVYILGYTLLQENTDDELRGRTFTTLLTLVRLCVLGAMVAGPALAAVLEPLLRRWISGRADRDMPGVRWFGVNYGVPGVRVSLWLGGVVILVAASVASRSIGAGSRRTPLADTVRSGDDPLVEHTEGAAAAFQATEDNR